MINKSKYKDIDKDSAINREEELLQEFVNLAIKRFKWSNLPKGLTSDRLEEMLINYGMLGGFINEVDLFTILPIQGNGKINIYNEHDEYRIFGFNGYNRTINSDDVCRLKNNPVGCNDIDTLMIYAKRINDIEQTQEVNLFQQNIPKIIATNRDGVLTAKNIIKKLRDFKLVIYTREKGINNQIKSDDILDTTAPFLLDKLGDYENFYRNKVLSFLAINNANTDKKERLLVDEVNANNDLLNTMLDMMFECRQEFCEEVKEKFNIDIKVEKREVNEQLHVDTSTNNQE